MNDDQPQHDDPEDGPPEEERLVQRILDTITPDTRAGRVELLITVILAIAGVLTAWSALQSAKWSGEQAIHFSEAGASRTESVRFDGRATSAILLDVQTFLQWASAIQAERMTAEANGEEPTDPTVFDPADGSLSGYLFTQFREDFQPRVRAWIEGGGPLTPDGLSPFDPFDDYLADSVPAAVESTRLAEAAEASAGLARQDNQNSDDYVLTIVILASVLFFAGVSSKMRTTRSQYLLVAVALLMLGWAVIRLAVLPIHAIP